MDATIKALTEEVADHLGKDGTEFLDSLISSTDEKDGIVYKSDDDIKSYIRQQLKDKMRTIESNTKDETVKRARKEVLKEVEDFAKSEYGVEMLWRDDKFTKLSDHFTETNKLTPEDVKKSKLYKSLVSEHDSTVHTLKTEHAEARKTLINQRAMDYTLRGVERVLSDPKNKRKLQSTDEANRELFAIVANRLTRDNYRPSITDSRKLIMINEEGEELTDNDHNIITFKKAVLSNTGSLFEKLESEPKKATGGPGAPDGGPSSLNGKEGGEVFKYFKDGKEKSYVLPAFTTQAEYGNILFGISSQKDIDTEVIEKLEAVAASTFKED